MYLAWCSAQAEHERSTPQGVQDKVKALAHAPDKHPGELGPVPRVTVPPQPGVWGWDYVQSTAVGVSMTWV